MAKYLKTAKGQEEINSRTHGLGLRARRVLILVDGERDTDVLAAMSGAPDVEDVLTVLVEGGFIEASVAPQAAATASAAVVEPIPAPKGAGASAEKVKMARDFMMNTLRTFHGPYGKLDLVKRIHSSNAEDELHGLFDEWLVSITETSIGRKRADELSARLRGVLAGS